MKKKLNTAIKVAVDAHMGQYDKAGYPYILHPIRVSERLELDEDKIVAVLHDVIEDTDVDITFIRNTFGDRIAKFVDNVTKRSGESYRQYLDRVNSHTVSRNVKLADMEDNTRPERLDYLSVAKRVRLAAKYARARHYLLTGEWYEHEGVDQVIKDGYKK
jgi:(p)ppGpp synthase/HD superfamily hydrolase